MKKLKIDLYAVFNQQTSITLAGVRYYFYFLWSDISDTWIYSIYDKNNKPILTGRAVQLNVNLFENVSETGELIMEGEKPTRLNLGKTCNLYFYEFTNES